MPKVYNKHHEFPMGALYVGRPSPWGNPFAVTRTQSRQTAIARFKIWLDERLRYEPDFLTPLKGKDLVCWCAPLACHADVLLEKANLLVEDYEKHIDMWPQGCNTPECTWCNL